MHINRVVSDIANSFRWGCSPRSFVFHGLILLKRIGKFEIIRTSVIQCRSTCDTFDTFLIRRCRPWKIVFYYPQFASLFFSFSLFYLYSFFFFFFYFLHFFSFFPFLLNTTRRWKFSFSTFKETGSRKLGKESTRNPRNCSKERKFLSCRCDKIATSRFKLHAFLRVIRIRRKCHTRIRETKTSQTTCVTNRSHFY